MKELLIKLDACDEAKDWAGDKTWEEVYNTCHRGDWLLWLFQRTNPNDLQLLTLAKGHCANTVRHLMTDERSTKAVDAAISFGEGKISREELEEAVANASAAADAAWSACIASNYAADAASDRAAAYAARAAHAVNAVNAADAAYYAAYAAARAACIASNYADAAREENQQLTANICRKYLPIEVWNV